MSHGADADPVAVPLCASADIAERGRACLEFWLGIAAARDIDIAIPKNSSLMDALYPQQQRLYGYDTLDISMRQVYGQVRVAMTPHDNLPTADEIEARYDHSAHPNPMVAA